MYQELLEIVAETEEDSGASTDATVADSRGYAPNMPVVAEESETEYPSFNQKKPSHLQRGDSEFDEVINNVLGENNQAQFRRDDLSDDDDEDAYE